ncbi:nitroreductase family protein [Calidifontibacter terrae]
MELLDAIRRRRMVRRYTDAPVSEEVLARVANLALRAPSAGFSQGWDFLLLRTPGDRDRFWETTTEGDPDSWLRGLMTAPVLILCLSDKNTYLRRYAQDDKGWVDESEARWPVPYWDIDTGMAALIMLLVGVDAGLGGLFFGVPADRVDAVRAQFGIPADRGVVGVVALGTPAQTRPSGSTRKRRRRPVSEVFHEGAFGTPANLPDAMS